MNKLYLVKAQFNLVYNLSCLTQPQLEHFFSQTRIKIGHDSS